MDSDLERMRTITENLESWQGLRFLHGGLLTMEVGMMWLLSQESPPWWHLPFAETLALFLVLALLTHPLQSALDRYYRRTFGAVVVEMSRQERNRRLPYAFPWVWTGIFLDRILFIKEIPLLASGPALAFVLLRHWSRTGRGRPYYPVLAVLATAATLLPLAFPILLSLSLGIFFLVAGGILCLLGVLDHLALRRYFQPIPETDLRPSTVEPRHPLKSPVPALERMRAVTESYESWQGLRVVPMGLSIIVLALFSRLDRPAGWPLAPMGDGVLVMIALLLLHWMSVVIDRSYRETFGEVVASSRSRRFRQSGLMLSLIIGALVVESSFELPILLSGLTAAGVALVHWNRTGRGRGHYFVFIALFVAATFLPLFVPLWANVNAMMDLAAVGGAILTLIGALDHRALSRAMHPLPAEAGETT